MNSSAMNRDSQHPLDALGIKIEESNTDLPKPRAMRAGVGLLAAPAPGIIRRIGKIIAGKFFLMVAVSVCTQFVLKPDSFWRLMRVIFSLIGMLGDQRILHSVTTVFEKSAEVAKQQTVPDDGEKPKPTLGEKLKGGVDNLKNESKKVVDEKVKPLEKDARNAYVDLRDRLGPPNSNAGGGDAPERSGQRTPPPPDYVPPYTGGGMGSIPQPIQGAVTSARNGAVNLGKQIVVMGQAVGKAVQQQARAGYNAACPYCRRPMNLADSAHKRRTCMNPKCGASFLPSEARRMVHR